MSAQDQTSPKPAPPAASLPLVAGSKSGASSAESTEKQAPTRLMRKPAVSLVAAMSENRIIGFGGRLPWHLPEDLQHFRKLTLDHTIIMGRKTYESIRRPLPRRRNIVVTRRPLTETTGVECAASLSEALQKCRGQERVFVIGGGEIFREALPITDRIHLTLVYFEEPQPSLFGPIPGDAFFPAIRPNEWRISSLGRQKAARLGQSPKSTRNAKGIYYRFIDLERTIPSPGRRSVPDLERFHWSLFRRASSSRGKRAQARRRAKSPARNAHADYGV
jgi:dihydrofolate reductase